MQVVLRQDVESLGLRGEVVNVARGYARNFLLPRGLAELATPGLVRELEKRDAQRARHEAQSVRRGAGDREAARGRPSSASTSTPARPGSLFGSVTATNVADRLWEDLKIRIDRRKLDIGTIKRIGRYTVPGRRCSATSRPSSGCSSFPKAASCRPRRSSSLPRRPRRQRPSEAAAAHAEAESLVEAEIAERRGRRGGRSTRRPRPMRRPSRRKPRQIRPKQRRVGGRGCRHGRRRRAVRPPVAVAHRPLWLRGPQASGSAGSCPQRLWKEAVPSFSTRRPRGVDFAPNFPLQRAGRFRPPHRPLHLRTYVLSCLHTAVGSPDSCTAAFHSVAAPPRDRFTSP